MPFLLIRNKFIILICIFLFCDNNLHAQNLVHNPSFEDTVSCPNAIGNINQCEGWFSLGESPDYWNSCANNNFPFQYGVPRNIFGSQAAYDGNAYAGIVTYDELSPSFREIIGTRLVNPLAI